MGRHCILAARGAAVPCTEPYKTMNYAASLALSSHVSIPGATHIRLATATPAKGERLSRAARRHLPRLWMRLRPSSWLTSRALSQLCPRSRRPSARSADSATARPCHPAASRQSDSSPIQRTRGCAYHHRCHQSPFHSPGVTTRDDHPERIVELAEERSLALDHDVCQRPGLI